MLASVRAIWECETESPQGLRRWLGMYAVFTEVNATESSIEAAREVLPQFAVPAARERGAKRGYWLAPQGGRGIAVHVFETEEEAQKAAAMLQIGQPPMPQAPEGVTVKTVEVREILAEF